MRKAESEVTKMRPADIKIGDRVRKDLGDIDALVRDIEEIGLLQPVVVTLDGTLIAGARRLQAWSRSSHARDHIPVHRVDLAAIVRGEFSENFMRKQFTPSEAVAIKREIEVLLKKHGKDLQRAHGGTTHGKKSQCPQTHWRTDDEIAKTIGLGRSSLRKAEAVVVAAARDPERFSKFAEQMDRTGKVDRAFNMLRWSVEKFSRKDREKLELSVFDEKLLPGRSVGSARAADVIRNAHFWGYLAEHMGVPPDASMSLREFEKPSLIRKALDFADQKDTTI